MTWRYPNLFFRPGSPDVGRFCGLKIVLLLSTLAFLVESFFSFSSDSMNSVPNVAYYIHLAHDIPNEPDHSFDHLVFFNGKTKYILAKNTFQDLNICSLADLEGARNLYRPALYLCRFSHWSLGLQT